ncbi:MAG: tryptophan synthase subunit alpha [Desulfobacterota bacterium]|nr:tryptophan synthase subunit alpha [Thermodesulfobacteriota bacterium]
MNRISEVFQQLKSEGKKALITYITVGDPSLPVSREVVKQLIENGADMLELGVPFSDPTADGQVIQAASQRALKRGTNLNNVLELAKEIRNYSSVPIILFSYYNPLFIVGEEEVTRKAKEAGIDGVLVVDLPYEECEELKKYTDQANLDLIFLLAPTTTESRVKMITQKARGFLYYISMTGVTGSALSGEDEIAAGIQRIKKYTELPVAVGFGISTPEQAQTLGRFAEGVVVGSALVRIIEKYQDTPSQLLKEVGKFVDRLKKVL